MQTVRTPDERGQTGLDFVIGIGIFLLAVGFLVAFAPNMVAPHSDSPELPLVADRAANYAVSQIETNPSDFFTAKAPLVEGYEVKVILVKSDDTLINKYETVPQQGSSSIAVAHRVVEYGGETAYLTVEVWK